MIIQAFIIPQGIHGKDHIISGIKLDDRLKIHTSITEAYYIAIQNLLHGTACRFDKKDSLVTDDHSLILLIGRKVYRKRIVLISSIQIFKNPLQLFIFLPYGAGFRIGKYNSGIGSHDRHILSCRKNSSDISILITAKAFQLSVAGIQLKNFIIHFHKINFISYKCNIIGKIFFLPPLWQIQWHFFDPAGLRDQT